MFKKPIYKVIESETEDRFSKLGTDDDQCVGVRDYGVKPHTTKVACFPYRS